VSFRLPEAMGSGSLKLEKERPYSKSKLEFESKSSEILSVNCKLIRGSTT